MMPRLCYGTHGRRPTPSWQLARFDAALAGRIPDLRKIVAFRNILIHGYALIDRARVWRVVQDELPALHKAVQDLLAEQT